MRVSAAVAMARNGVIGRQGALPWRLSDDLKLFKALTWGKPIVMGRKTHQAIGRALPGRTNIVVTRDPAFQVQGCIVVRDPEAAFAAARERGAGEVVVIGGAELYRQTLPHVSRVYLTLVDADVEGDVKIPPFEPSEWREVSREAGKVDEKNELPHVFLVLERRTSE